MARQTSALSSRTKVIGHRSSIKTTRPSQTRNRFRTSLGRGNSRIIERWRLYRIRSAGILCSARGPSPEQHRMLMSCEGGAHGWRIIYMAGPAHPDGHALNLTLMGHSIGHWENDTL